MTVIWLPLTTVRTLISMFPDLDKDIIDDVVREKQGRYVMKPLADPRV